MRSEKHRVKIGRWLDPINRPHNFWLSKHCVGVAWVGLLAALISPSHGGGIIACWFQEATGFPCPGCGLWRSVSCGIRGMFWESWNYHPMGLLVLGLFVFTAGQSVLPKDWRDNVRRWTQTPAWTALYLAFVVAFVSFGAIRALCHWMRA